jgi:hypothetical protein
MLGALFINDREAKWPGYARVALQYIGGTTYRGEWKTGAAIEANSVIELGIFQGDRMIAKRPTERNELRISKGHAITIDMAIRIPSDNEVRREPPQAKSRKQMMQESLEALQEWLRTDDIPDRVRDEIKAKLVELWMSRPVTQESMGGLLDETMEILLEAYRANAN